MNKVKKKRTTVYIPEDVHKKTKRMCFDVGITVSDYISYLLMKNIKQPNEED